ncbi:uncharacterized protein Z520_02742 [Fonsecaea multimorphosa CBS 102226]|uniref:VOC domain-containing protein n=1 Tax=Fonsecaea multimorphosa CBS 102226 TaxID=1442371 RepID=A0A0D2KDA4_9EURO|nr:uncharacterized protein Z520_02742 [Fonsecaea multimorphosa CBS 102226]KIY01190.1 hypothetical protein Z520_02742 [Fonsecaea multimorphosa CBS 102226]OAL28802.1 hypothetical protein AYO22_02667 [Fonsecaea multimorphosa]
MPITSDDQRIRLVRTAFVTYYHRDVHKASKFLLDFGFEIAEQRGDEVIFFKGYGPDPYCYVARRADDEKGPRFGGAAYLVESEAELERATKTIPGASAISKLDAPGGGSIVTLKDPVGHLVHLVHGIREEKPSERPAEDKNLQKLVVNYEDEKRRVGKFQRFQRGRPAPVHKWGHYGVSYPPGMYQDMVDWYTGHLALAFSDKVTIGGNEAVSFFHIDRGLEYTDHHSFYIKPTRSPDEKPDVAHSAFEVHDYDIQQLGHNYLESKGYKLSWGVGRHVLGSQIFDYWYDESGFELEHYADGDLVNCETEVTVQENGPHTMYVWGPPRPAARG